MGAYLTPTVMEVPAELAPKLKCVRDENFFPLLPVIKVDAEDDLPRTRDRAIFERMKALLGQNEYGLRLRRVRDTLDHRKMASDFAQSGLLRINSRPVGFSPAYPPMAALENRADLRRNESRVAKKLASAGHQHHGPSRKPKITEPGNSSLQQRLRPLKVSLSNLGHFASLRFRHFPVLVSCQVLKKNIFKLAVLPSFPHN